jgi:PAS domain S-box-containing protein
MNKFLNDISHLGISEKTPRRIARKIKASNRILFLSFLLLLFSFPFNIFFGPAVINYFLVGWMAVVFSCLVLNHLKYLSAARIFFLATNNLIICSFALIFDRTALIGSYLFVNLASIFVLFDFKEKKQIITSLLICLGSYTFLISTHGYTVLNIEQPWEYMMSLRLFNISASILLTVLYIVYLVYENARFQNTIESEREISLSIINASRDAIWMVDKNFIMLSFNKKAAQAMKDSSGIELHKGLDIIAAFEKAGFGESAKLWSRVHQEAINGKTIHEEFNLSSRQGEHCLEITLSPFHFNGSDDFAIAIFIRNITEKKRIETQRIKYQKFIEQSSDIMLVVDAETNKITDANQCAIDSLGYTKNDLITFQIDRVKCNKGDHKWELVKDTIKEKPNCGECTLLCADGSSIPVEANISMIYHENNCYILIAARNISRRLQFEQRINEQHQFLTQIINSNPNPIWVKNEQGRYTMVNKAMALAHNTSTEEMIGKTDLDFGFCPDEIEFYNRIDREVFETLRISRYHDESFTHPVSGEKKWYDIIKAPVISNHETQVLGIAIDISDRKKLETEVSELNMLQKTIIDGTELSVISTDLNGCITSFNKVSEALLGYTAAEVIGKINPSGFLDKDEFFQRSIELSKEFGRHIEPGLESLTIKANMGISERKEWTVIRKNGTRFTASCLISLMRGSDGEPLGYLIVSSDVTEKIKIEKQIRKIAEEEKRQSFINNGLAELSEVMRRHFKDTDKSYRKAVSFIINYISAHQGCLYVATAEETDTLIQLATYAMGQNPKLRGKIKIGEGLIGQAALDRKSILLRDVEDSFIRIDTGSGLAIPKNIAIVPLLFEKNLCGVVQIASLHEFTAEQFDFLERAAGVLGSTIDVDNRKSNTEKLLSESQKLNQQLQQKEEELRHQKDELIQFNQAIQDKALLLEARNAELENARRALKLKAEELEINNRYKSDFLANMSHELRTPLNSILILSNLLLENIEHNLNDKQKQFAQVINRSGTDLLNLINDVLDLAKIEAGKIEMNFEKFPVASIADDMRMLFEEVANEKQIDFRIRCDENIPSEIENDRQRIGQVIKNLLSNAFKFTQPLGAITMEIAFAGSAFRCNRPDLSAVPKLLFRVSDNGIGIPMEKQRQIFEAFSQADSSTSRKYGGTGLGLSISKELASRMNGEIQLQSEEGRGSTFTLILPVGEILNPLPIPTQEKQIDVISMPVIPLNEIPDVKKVLIIEDDDKYAFALKKLASNRGFESVIAESGEEGLLLAYQEPFSAILLDINLPCMDGWEVMRRLKSDEMLSHIPVHVMSGVDYAEQSNEMGAQGFTLKEISEFDNFRTLFDNLNAEMSWEKCRALIIEDSLTQSEQIKNLLSDRFLRSDIALTGQYALEMIRKQVYEIIVLDLNLPDTNGINLLKKIRADRRYDNTKIIVYTGLTLTNQVYQELSRYSNTIIQKTATSYEQLITETNSFLHDLRQQNAGPLRSEPIDFQGKKVLLVDDDMRNIFALSYVLESRGMKVFISNDGREAIEMLKINPDMDAVLLDMMMPVMDGYETARIIRATPGFEDLPVISVTASAMKGDREKCLEAGANDYLTKPVHARDLMQTLSHWINTREAQPINL